MLTKRPACSRGNRPVFVAMATTHWYRGNSKGIDHGGPSTGVSYASHGPPLTRYLTVRAVCVCRKPCISSIPPPNPLNSERNRKIILQRKNIPATDGIIRTLNIPRLVSEVFDSVPLLRLAGWKACGAFTGRGLRLFPIPFHWQIRRDCQAAFLTSACLLLNDFLIA